MPKSGEVPIPCCTRLLPTVGWEECVWKLSILAKDTNPEDKVKACQCLGKLGQESSKFNPSRGQGKIPPVAREAVSSVA